MNDRIVDIIVEPVTATTRKWAVALVCNRPLLFHMADSHGWHVDRSL
ncbi:hypothetical protein BIFGAL_04429 [Bifidobacterium gallicum DSM 20093 = LMG 11596]|uniref:Uncharacterized protein n=1 Tax=Bifidobacterium gallicum DSM 20093 = LMG 11596 TaxID=561180 RepID=D1NX21_9BIFI|nr:hypothetical protein BIFGAL_04429 [Bifidobacterium gallicum DSM 20093 = LMG 11596]